MTSQKGNSDNSAGLAGLLSAVLAQTSAIQAADNDIDGKANNLMAAALVIIALLGTQLRDGVSHWNWYAIASMFVLIIAVALVAYLTRSRQYAGAVVDLRTHSEYFTKDDALLLAQLTEDANQANDDNNKILEDKQRFFRYSTLVFLMGFSVGILSLFMAHH